MFKRSRMSYPVALLALVTMTLGLSGMASAATVAAKVIMASGQTTATDSSGNSRPLARRSEVHVGDTLRTGDGSLLQLRFSDKALMTLRANSELLIEQYAKGSGDEDGSALMQLVTGGFRTITGSIGKGSSDAYQVRTAAASIGIRGTHYDVLQTGGNLLLGVLEGGITVSNDRGTLEIGQDRAYSYSLVVSGQAPKGLSEPPPELEETSPVIEVEESEGASSEEDEGTEETADTGTTDETGTDPALEEETDTSLASETESDTTLTTDTTTTDTTDTTQTESGDLSLTESDTQLQQDLEESNTVTQSTVDPRLTTDEYDQVQAATTLTTLVSNGAGERVLATLIAPQTITPFDFSTQGFGSFDLRYETNGGNTVNTVTIFLSSNVQDLNSLITDIQDDLSTAGAPIDVRESQFEPGKLEFYTTNNNTDLFFTLENFETSTAGSTTITDLEDALGGLAANASAQGEERPNLPILGIMLFDSDGNKSGIVVPDFNPDTETDADRFVKDSTLEPYVVGRQGEAPETVTETNVGGRSNISWGVWEASPDNPLYIYEDRNNPESFFVETQPMFWLSAEAANTADLTGIANFAATGTFLGRGHDGAVDALSGSFTVDFDNATITDGLLFVSTPNNDWNADFTGQYANAQAIMQVNGGDIIGTNGCTACVNGGLSGVFVAPGDAFAGGFNLQQNSDVNVHVEGLMLMEQQ